MTRRIAVIGTGTEIGKTHAAVSLVTAMSRRGLSVTGLKPIESGVGQGCSDVDRLAMASSTPPTPAPYAFEAPVSPHLAARQAGLAISLDEVRLWVDRQSADWLVIETAGALLSPLGPGLTNADLVRRLSPDAIVLVASDRLGVLHDVSACRLALKTLAPELPAPLVVLQPPARADASTGTNEAELVTLGIVDFVVALPRSDPRETAAVAVAERLLDRIV